MIGEISDSRYSEILSRKSDPPLIIIMNLIKNLSERRDLGKFKESTTKSTASPPQ